MALFLQEGLGLDRDTMMVLPDVLTCLAFEDLARLSGASIQLSRQLTSTDFVTRLAELRQVTLEQRGDPYAIPSIPPFTVQEPTLEALHMIAALQSVAPDVFFERASSEIASRCKASMEKLGRLLRTHTKAMVFVAGHCGRGAPPSIWSSFSQERAESVCFELLECGVCPHRPPAPLCPPLRSVTCNLTGGHTGPLLPPTTRWTPGDCTFTAVVQRSRPGTSGRPASPSTSQRQRSVSCSLSAPRAAPTTPRPVLRSSTLHWPPGRGQ